MIFDALVVGSWRRHALRTVLTLVAIAFAVASLVTADLAAAFSHRALEARVAGTGGETALQLFAPSRAGAGGLDPALVRAIAELPGVSAARPAIDAAVELRAAGGRTARAELLGTDALQAFPGSAALRAVDPGPFAPPSAIDRALVAGRGAVVPAALAAALAVVPGATLRARTATASLDLRAVAVAAAGTPGVDPGAVVVDVATAAALLRTGGTVSRIDVAAEPAAAAGVERAVAALAPQGARVARTAERVAALERLGGGFAANVALASWLALALACVLVANAATVAVRQRGPDVATLRAFGATRRSIFAAFAWEGALLGSGGAFAGALLGDRLARAASGSPETALADAAADLAILARDAGLVLAIALAATLLPAVRAASIPPARAFRTAPPPELGRASAAVAALGCALAAASAGAAAFATPARAGWALAAVALFTGGVCLSVPALPALVARVPERLLEGLAPAVRLAVVRFGATSARMTFAIVALALAVCASVGVATAAASFRATIAASQAASLPGDLVVRPDALANAGLPAALAARLRAVRGVASAGTVRRTETRVGAETVALAALDAASLRARGTPLRPGEASVTGDLARRLGLRAGGTLELRTPRGPLALRVVAVPDAYGSLAGEIAMDAAAYARAFGDGTVDAVVVALRPGTDAAVVRAALAAAAAPVAVDVESSAALRASEAATFARPFALGSAIALGLVAVALASTIATAITVVAERRRELALLRTLGLSRAGLRTMLVCEAALVASLGGGVGAVAGLGLGILVVGAIDRGILGFPMLLRLPLATALAVPAAVVAVAVLAAPLTARLAVAALAVPALEEA